MEYKVVKYKGEDNKIDELASKALSSKWKTKVGEVTNGEIKIKVEAI